MPFGNFHYGFVGTAAAIPTRMLKVGAGMVSHDPGAPGHPGWNPLNISAGIGAKKPYRDSYFDQDMIELGAKLFGGAPMGISPMNGSLSAIVNFGTPLESRPRIRKRPCNDSEYQAFVNAPTELKPSK